MNKCLIGLLAGLVFSCVQAADAGRTFGTAEKNITVTPFMVKTGEPVDISLKLKLEEGEQFRAYRIFAYLPGLPADYVKSRQKEVKVDKHDKAFSSLLIRDWKWVRELPGKIRLDTRKFPAGDYWLQVQYIVRKPGKGDQYRQAGLGFCLRNHVRTVPTTDASDSGNILNVPCVSGFSGNPEGILNADVPFRTGFHVLGKTVKAPVQTRFKIFHDNDWIYIGVQADEPVRMKEFAELPVLGHNANPISDRECIELNLDPTGCGMSFYKLIINPNGDYIDYFGQDDNTNTGRFTFDKRWMSRSRIKVGRQETSWTVEAAILIGAMSGRSADPKAQWGFNVGRVRYPDGKNAEMSIFFPTSKMSLCAASEFGKIVLLAANPRAHVWEMSQPKCRTLPQKGGSLSLEVRTRICNRTGDFRFANVRAEFADRNGKITASDTVLVETYADRLRPVVLNLKNAVPGKGTLRLEILSAEGRPETTLWTDGAVEYEPVKIELTEPAYRDCVFESMKLKKITGNVRVEEGIGNPLTLTLEGQGITRKLEWKKAAAENPFAFPFENLPKGTYTLRAGKAVKTFRNLPFHSGEVWLDKNGVAYREGRKMLPFGWFSDTFVEEYPGLNIAQMYTSSIKTPETILKLCAQSGVFKRGLIISPLQDMHKIPRSKLFSVPALQQGSLTEEQKESIRNFVRAALQAPWFFAYYSVDEPEGRDLNPDWLADMRRYLMELDPYHPVVTVNYSIEGVKRFHIASDIMSPDAYPVFFTDGTTSNPRRVAYDKSKAASELTPAWLAPQFFDWDIRREGKTACGPTYDEQRSQIMMGLLGNVRGFLLYSRHTHGAYTQHMRLGPKFIAQELLESQDVFLSPSIPVKYSTEPAATAFFCALKKYGKETVLIAVNTHDYPVKAEFRSPVLPDGALTINGTDKTAMVRKGVLTDSFAPLETKVYSNFRKEFNYETALASVLKAEKLRRKPGNLCAASKFLNLTEMKALKAGKLDIGYPKITASSSKAVTYPALPFTYFLQDGIAEEKTLVSYMSWAPADSDNQPWIKVDFGSPKEIRQIVIYRLTGSDGQPALVSGTIEADGKKIASFDQGKGGRIAVNFSPVKTKEIIIRCGKMVRNAAQHGRVLSEIEVY